MSARRLTHGQIRWLICLLCPEEVEVSKLNEESDLGGSSSGSGRIKSSGAISDVTGRLSCELECFLLVMLENSEPILVF